MLLFVDVLDCVLMSLNEFDAMYDFMFACEYVRLVHNLFLCINENANKRTMSNIIENFLTLATNQPVEIFYGLCLNKGLKRLISFIIIVISGSTDYYIK